jgi:hypothetical protein
VVEILGYVLFALGAIVSCLNFYLSVVRYPLYKLLGLEYRWVSGLPLFGSLLLIVAVVILQESPFLFWSGLVIAIIDTGGLHWFAAVMLWFYVVRQRR